MKKQTNPRIDAPMGFDINKITYKEAQLYNRYLELIGLINDHYPKSIFDFRNKRKVKKYKKEMSIVLDKLAESGFWQGVINIA